MTTYDRRLFLARSARLLGGAALLPAAGLLAACGDDDDDGGDASPGTTGGGSGTGPLGSVAIQFNWIPDIEWAAYYLADAKGFFGDQRVEPVFNHGGPNTPAAVQVLAGGGSNIGISSTELDVITAKNTGADFIAIGAMYQRGPLGFAWLTETDIDTAADLVGKRIGAPQGRQLNIDAFFRVNDLEPEYEFIPMSFDPQPLVDGEVDVITAYVTNQPVQLELRDIDVTARPLSEFGLPTYGDILFASRAYVEENRDAVVGYLAALSQGVRANIADPEEVIPLLLETYGADAEINEEYSRIGNTRYIELYESDYTEANGVLAIDPAYLESDVWPGYEAAGEANLPDPADFVDTTLVADAQALL